MFVCVQHGKHKLLKEYSLTNTASISISLLLRFLPFLPFFPPHGEQLSRPRSVASSYLRLIFSFPLFFSHTHTHSLRWKAEVYSCCQKHHLSTTYTVTVCCPKLPSECDKRVLVVFFASLQEKANWNFKKQATICTTSLHARLDKATFIIPARALKTSAVVSNWLARCRRRCAPNNKMLKHKNNFSNCAADQLTAIKQTSRACHPNM